MGESEVLETRGPPAAAGRSVWTLLFTDIVGSTEHLARLGDAGWRDVLTRHARVVHDEARRHDGWVVRDVGDGFFVAFTAPVEAIGCAVAICGAVRRLGLEIRAGIHTGECELLGDNLMGLSVHIAARVSSTAEASEVLVSGTVRELMAGSETDLVDRDEHVLRGVPGTWRLYSVRAPELEVEADADAPVPPVEATGSVPLPRRLRAAMEGPLFGRDGELARLSTGLDRAAAGERQAILLAGEPGIGKTRLVAQAASAASRAGAIVVYGRCDEDLGVPYQPFVEAIDHYLDHAPPALLARHRSEHGAELGRLAPRLARAGDGPGLAETHWPEADHYVLFAAVAGLVSTAAAHRPVVLVLDDLHWADSSSLLLLRYLLTSPTRMRCLIVGTFRSTELTQDHPLRATLADLRREPGVARLDLGGLAEADVAGIAEALAGERFDAAATTLARTLRDETNGNPYFVTEMLRHLTETGDDPSAAVERFAGEHPAPDVLPGSVRETIARRVERLGADGGRALTAAAVIGQEFDVQLLAEVLGQDVDEVLDELDAAVEAALVTEVPAAGTRYAFAHALVGHTLYDDLRPGRRRVLHAQVTGALESICGEDVGGRIGELAHHAFEGTPSVDVTKTLRYACMAGEHALSQRAPEEAVRWYRRALELASRDSSVTESQRSELMIGLGTAQCESGDPEFRETLLEASGIARRLGDDDRLVRAALANTRGFVSETGVVDEDRVSVLEGAITAVGEEDSGERARLLAILAAELTFSGDWRRRLDLSNEALAIARRLNDPATLNEVLSARFITIWTPETLDERYANTADELAIAERDGDPVARFRALHWRYTSCVERGELEEATRLVERETQLAETLRQPVARWLAAYDRATHALMRGLLVEADVLATEALQVATDSGQPEALAFYAGQLLNIRFEQGGLGELEPLIAQQVADNPGIPAFRPALALARTEAGMDDAAREVLAVDRESKFSELAYDSNWLVGIAIYAEATARLEDAGAAAALYDLLAPWRDQIAFNSATAWGAVTRHLGNLDAVLGRHEDAERHLLEAARVHERIGAPLWLARTRLDLARLLTSRGGDPERSRALLEQALATARDLGAAGIERRARDLLAA